jgi:hypothetical protein
MRDVPEDAKRMVNAYGRDAAGECLSRAMDSVSKGDSIDELYWFAVAMFVMDLQGLDKSPPVDK